MGAAYAGPRGAAGERADRRRQGSPRSLAGMCRNITTLRGLEPPATEEEVEAAARQFVRKISGITHPNAKVEERFEQAVAEIAHISAHLLADLPPRRQPPKNDPPLRRLAARA